MIDEIRHVKRFAFFLKECLQSLAIKCPIPMKDVTKEKLVNTNEAEFTLIVATYEGTIILRHCESSYWQFFLSRFLNKLALH